MDVIQQLGLLIRPSFIFLIGEMNNTTLAILVIALDIILLLISFSAI